MKFTSEEFDKILSEPYPTGTVWEFPAILDVYREIIIESFMIPKDLLMDVEKSGCSRLLWKQEVVGSNPTIHTKCPILKNTEP